MCVATAAVGLLVARNILLYLIPFGFPIGLLIAILVVGIVVWLGVQTIRRLRLNTLASLTGATTLGVIGLLLIAAGVRIAQIPAEYWY